jgi:Tol biopolymer transport system component
MSRFARSLVFGLVGSLGVCSFSFGVFAMAQGAQAPAAATAGVATLLPAERRLSNLKQLTFGGENAEAYFSFDGQRLSFQSSKDRSCDQIFSMRIDGTDMRMVSSGEGRTTCAHYMPDGQSIVYASTHLGGKECPPVPGRDLGYVWPIYDTYDIFRVNVDGTGLRRLTSTPGYDAEATVAKDGTIVFTSVRDGDMDIYTMSADGSNVRRLTNLPGPDGGPFFSADGSKIVFRGRHPPTGPERNEFFDFLKKGIWRPTSLEVFTMNRDGSNLRQVTNTGTGANWAPFFTPDGKQIIYASNAKNPRGNNFDLFLVNIDGTGLEQITTSESFDGFPMFSPDGRKLVFASNRNAAREGDTNVFIADWK